MPKQKEHSHQGTAIPGELRLNQALHDLVRQNEILFYLTGRKKNQNIKQNHTHAPLNGEDMPWKCTRGGCCCLMSSDTKTDRDGYVTGQPYLMGSNAYTVYWWPKLPYTVCGCSLVKSDKSKRHTTQFYLCGETSLSFSLCVVTTGLQMFLQLVSLQREEVWLC